MRAPFALFVTLLSATLLLQAQNESKSADETKILALENAWNLAEEHKDAGALDQLLAGTLVYTDYDGTFMDKGQFLAQVKQPSVRPAQILNESMTVRLYGDAAVVTGIYREKGTSSGKPYMRRGRFTDTWVTQNSTWQCVASQSTLITR